MEIMIGAIVWLCYGWKSELQESKIPSKATGIVNLTQESQQRANESGFSWDTGIWQSWKSNLDW